MDGTCARVINVKGMHVYPGPSPLGKEEPGDKAIHVYPMAIVHSTRAHTLSIPETSSRQYKHTGNTPIRNLMHVTCMLLALTCMLTQTCL